MSDHKQEPKSSAPAGPRRKLLKGLAAGGGVAVALPQKWTRPVVDSVMLPAHAQTSPAATTAPTVFALDCASPIVTANLPAGDAAPPGPNVSIAAAAGGSVSAQLTVTPVPPAGSTTAVNILRMGVDIAGSPTNVPISATTGRSTTVMVGIGAVGPLEVRFTFAGRQCSLYWNCVL